MAPTKKASVKTASKAKKPETKAKPKEKKEKKKTKGGDPFGRPTLYKPEYVKIAQALCERGATDAEIAKIFDVDCSTIYRWKLDHPDFCEAMVNGKQAPDERVERSLYHRAVGATVIEQEAIKLKKSSGGGVSEETVVIVNVEKTFPPDTQACSLWLRNRRPDRWKDKVEHTHEGGDRPFVIDMSGKSKDERDALRQVVASIAVSSATDS